MQIRKDEAQNNKKSSYSSELGFGMGEVMVGGTVFAILAYFMTNIITIRNREISALRLLNSRDNALGLLKKYASDPLALTSSMNLTGSPGNLAFSYCFNGSPASGPSCAPNCCATTTTSPQPFNLIDPLDAAGTSVLSGTDAVSTQFPTPLAPARYDVSGQLCVTPGDNCALEFVTSFSSDCSPSASPCSKASKIIIHITARQAINPANGIPFGPNSIKTIIADVNLR